MKILILSVTVFLLVLLLAVQVLGQSPVEAVPAIVGTLPPTIEVYLRALRELGSFGALLWLMYQHHKERHQALKAVLEQVAANTAALRTLEQYIRDRPAHQSRSTDE